MICSYFAQSEAKTAQGNDCRFSLLSRTMVFTPSAKAQFNEVYNKACGLKENDKNIVQHVDVMIKLLSDHVEAVVKFVHPKSVAVHNDNRGGGRMQSTKVYKKGSKILDVGVSLSKCDPTRAVAFSINPHKPESLKKFIEYTNNDKHMATFDPSAIEAMSVGCGHWNQFLCAIIDECEVPAEFAKNDALVGKSGGTKLDKDHILKQDGKDLGGLINNGLRWTVIRWSVEVEFPKLPFIIQKALNVEHNVGEGQLSNVVSGLSFECRRCMCKTKLNSGKLTSLLHTKIMDAAMRRKPAMSIANARRLCVT